MFNDPTLLEGMVKQITEVTETSVNVIFNCDSFDYEVAPSAIDSYTPERSRKRSSSSVVGDSSLTLDSMSTQTSLESTLEPSVEQSETASNSTLRRVSEEPSVISTSEPVFQESPPTHHSPVLVLFDHQTTPGQTSEVLEDEEEPKIPEEEPEPSTSELSEPSTPVKQRKISPESLLSSPEKLTTDEDDVEEQPDNRDLTEISSLSEQSILSVSHVVYKHGILNSVPLMEGIILEHLDLVTQSPGGHVTPPADDTLPSLDTASPPLDTASPSLDTTTPESPPTVEFPGDLLASSPKKEEASSPTTGQFVRFKEAQVPPHSCMRQITPVANQVLL